MSTQSEAVDSHTESRLRSVQMVLAWLDNDEPAWREAAGGLDVDDLVDVALSLAGLVISIGKDGYGSEDALRWRLRQLEGELAVKVEFVEKLGV